MSDLVRRLRAPRAGKVVEVVCALDDLCVEAADRIEALEVRLAELEAENAALREVSNDWQSRYNKALVDTDAAKYRLAEAEKVRSEDTELLDWLNDVTCDLRCVNVPTGGDDYDVDWVVIQHYMAKPREREIGRSYSDNPREAIRAARAFMEKTK